MRHVCTPGPAVRRARPFARLRAAVAAIACAWAGTAVATGHLGDFEALLAGLARHYANFEYTLLERRIDLPALAARQRAEFEAATTEAARRRAIEGLLRAFRDPHLRIEWQPAPGAPGPACGAHAPLPGVAFDRLPAFQPLASAEARLFGAGILRGRPTLGVIRIGLFIERAFEPACSEAAAALGLARDAACDDACGERLDRATAQILNQALAATVRELEAAGAARLVIDLTDNGGGSDWSELVARLLAGPLRSAPIAMVRHPAWTAQLQRLQAELAALGEGAAAAERERLRRATAQLEAALPELARPCDLGQAWTDRSLALGLRALPCSNLVPGALFATGPEASGPPTATGPIDALLFRPAWYGAYPSGVARRGLLVLINGETHSAAEQFAALLRDNGRAALVGQVSAGAGCGQFTAAGTSFTLPGSGARVHTPDCVRLRRDGSNERAGLVPDHFVPWSPADSAWQRVRKLVRVLQAP